ncbi:MAG: aminotransferase class V-fold PLP-dependent enzyme, partial [Lachnospiraceae bacterium]|nr:aminotransferase class V-fold PLP-dependent enzyme [Lachnospiraceae bacterium]
MKTHDKSILTGLADLSAGPVYPMHMPGHKRRDLNGTGLPCSYDITEITGFDDLHAPTGLLKEAMERATALFRTKRTFFLVNGSTCGILAAVGSLVKHGDRVIVARNCHSSVFHAVQVMDLAVSWVLPEYLSEYGIFGSVRPETVEEALKACPQAKAVIITSPTYEGVLSDISSIAAICHKAGALLIVDEAHGASLPFYEKSGYRGEYAGSIPFRELSHLSALSCQADLIAQSAHKTLPALTQTAFLHIGRDSVFLDEKRIREQLSVYETSSPSYLFLASLDACISLIAEKGTELYTAYEENLALLYNALSGLRKLRVFYPSVSFTGCF